MTEVSGNAGGHLRAIGQVVRAINRSSGDVAPVYAVVLDAAQQLLEAESAALHRVVDGELEVVAVSANNPVAALKVGARFPLDPRSVVGRAALSGRTVHVPDAHLDPSVSQSAPWTRLGVPVLSGADTHGVIAVAHVQPRPFTPDQIALLETFAQQVAIAIENVRLFNETREALERQTAVSNILKVISASPTDIKPVLDAIASSAARFTGAEDASVLLVRDGVAETRAHHGPITNPFSVPLDRDSVTGAAIIEGRLVHVRDVTDGDDYPISKALSLENDEQRTVLAAPLMRDESAIGAIVLRRREPQAFSDRQVDLVRVFADQAVIAIENVRLFNQTKEALQQQTAMSDVLATISRSAFDLPTVLRTIAERAVGLATAGAALIFRTDGAELVLVARHPAEDSPYVEEFLRLGGRQPIDGPTLPARAVRTLSSQYVEDVRLDPALPQSGTRTRFAVPIQRDGQALGAIVVTRVEVAPFTERQRALVETFADQAAIAIENVRLFNETKEALDQQTATSEVLQSISRSAFDLQGVLDTVVERAAQLCGAEQAWMRRSEGDEFRFAAYYGSSAELRELFDELRRDGAVAKIDHRGLGGRAVLEKQPIHVHDITADEGLREASLARRGGGRTALAVPMLRDGEPIGAIVVARNRVAPFNDREIRLVETFADQAVIAIENVRLFSETKEALERQTAVSEILRVMAGSPTDVTPVLQAIAESAARFCGAENVSVILEGEDGLLHPLGHVGSLETRVRPFPVDRTTVTGRSMLEGQPVHVHDLQAESEEFPLGSAQARAMGHRTTLATPLVRAGRAFGAILLRRGDVRPFTEKQVDLVRTFADQAVIAIENVRLFNETKEALAQQTAVSDVLATISRSAFDLQPVLDTVTERATRLSGATQGVMYRVDGQVLRYAAGFGPSEALMALNRRNPIRLDDRGTLSGRVTSDRRTIHIPDVLADPDYTYHEAQELGGFRAMLGVPLLREGDVIGVMSLWRTEPAPFGDREIAIVETFANQAAIAIENVRLFNEIQNKSQQLEIAGRHKSEFLANMSHELRTPLNAIIGFSDVLLNGMFGQLNEKQREYQEDVLSSGRHLLTLINDILDLSKIEAGRVDLELGEFSLPEALESGVTMIRERAARHGIRVQVEVADVDRIVADERKVKQIVFNLLSNAVKFTPDGGRVDVSAARNNGEVRVAVRDNGIGIDEADRERIFEEFQQASRDPERSREGTGLGLALSKRYVELHGGRIWVESEVGRGSTFTFALPLVPAGKEG